MVTIILPNTGMLFWMVILTCRSEVEAVVLVLLATDAFNRPPATEIAFDCMAVAVR